MSHKDIQNENHWPFLCVVRKSVATCKHLKTSVESTRGVEEDDLNSANPD